MTTSTTTLPTPSGAVLRHRSQRARPVAIQGGLLDPRLLWQVDAGRVAQARSAHAVDEPGHVHRRGRRRVHDGARGRCPAASFGWLIVIWLWLTALFANLAEAVAEGRGKAQADALRRAKTDTIARRLVDPAGARRGRGAGSRRRTSGRAIAWSARPET